MAAFRCSRGHTRLTFGCPACIEAAGTKAETTTHSKSETQQTRHNSNSYSCPICGRPTRSDVMPGTLWCSFCGNDVISLRRAAVRKLDHWRDEAVLKRLVLDKDKEVRRIAVEKLRVLNWDVYRAAVGKLTDQALLAELAVEHNDEGIRRIAVEQINDQAFLEQVASRSRWLEIKVIAIGKMTNQTILCQWAEKDHQAAIRLASVRQIQAENFLVQRLPAEPSASVRSALIAALRQKDSLRQVALTAYRQEDREYAEKRLRQAMGFGWFWQWVTQRGNPVSEVAAAHKLLAKRSKQVASETDSGKLLAIITDREFDVLCATAARRLSDPAALEKAATLARDRQVLKILLAKVQEKSTLNRIATGAEDRAMRLAAAQKAGVKSWQEIFNSAIAFGGTVEMLGNALAAVSLFATVEPQAVEGVQNASLNLIRRGDESRIPEMVDLLEVYGDKTLAEDFLNCGQPDLNAAAVKWANHRGLSVFIGAGSHRAKWASYK